MSAIPLSVVIVSWNGMRHLPRCLAALLPQLPDGAELVLVDNGSADGMAAWARATHPAARVIQLPENLGFAGGVNAGLRAARGALLLLNDDVELIADDSVEVLLALAQEPDVAMAGAKLLFADGTLQHAGHVYNVAAYHSFFRWWGGELGPRALLVVERECSGVTAAAAVVKASVFEEIGGFCTAFPGNFNDVDFSLKIREKGYRIRTVDMHVAKLRKKIADLPGGVDNGLPIHALARVEIEDEHVRLFHIVLARRPGMKLQHAHLNE